MIVVEQRPIPAINVVTRSGATMQVQTKEKQHDKAWVRKTPEKVPTLDVGREKETFMGAKKDFVDPSTAVTVSRSFDRESKYTVDIFTELYEALTKSECFK